MVRQLNATVLASGRRRRPPCRADVRQPFDQGILFLGGHEESHQYDLKHPDGSDPDAGPLGGALLAAKAAGYSHVTIDATLIETDRVSAPGPTPGADLRWSGKHDQHGGKSRSLPQPRVALDV